MVIVFSLIFGLEQYILDGGNSEPSKEKLRNKRRSQNLIFVYVESLFVFSPVERTKSWKLKDAL